MPLFMNLDETDEELPEWVKLVNRLLHGERKRDGAKLYLDRGHQKS